MRRIDEKAQCTDSGAVQTVATEVLGKARDLPARHVRQEELRQVVRYQSTFFWHVVQV